MKEFIEHPKMLSKWRKPTKAVIYTVDKKDCHICISHQPNQREYPMISIDKKLIKMNRFIWEKYNGPIPKGAFICHKCDNKRCINPEHLYLGNPLTNSHDMIERGQFVPHNFTPEERAKNGNYRNNRNAKT